MGKINGNLKLPLVLKKIRNNYKLTVRELAKLSSFSSTYVSESENGYRMATLEYIESLKANLHLSEEEYKVLMWAYNRDRLNVSNDLLYYLIDNDLLDSLETIKEYDKKGNCIKELAVNLKNMRSRR